MMCEYAQRAKLLHRNLARSSSAHLAADSTVDSRYGFHYFFGCLIERAVSDTWFMQ